MRLAFFFAAVTLTAIGLHAYLGRRLVPALAPSPRARAAAWGLLALSCAALLLAFVGARYLERGPWSRPVAWVGFTAMGLVAVAFPLLLVRDLVLGAGLLATRALAEGAERGAAAEGPTRRELLGRASGGLVLGTTALVALAGAARAASRPRVEHVRVPLGDLPPGLEGLRIVQLSDLHLGPTLGRAFLEAVVDDALALAPDLVAVTGDLVDGRPDELADELAPLRRLRAPLGAYFVTGNHEYYWGAEAWVERVRALGLDALVNEHRVVERGGDRLVVAGVPDHEAATFVPAHAPDPAAALAGAPDGLPRLLLAHQPRAAGAAARAGFDLQLSGHTHGGQIFPYTWLIHLVQPVVAGLARVGGTWVYVNRGTGYWGPPMRSRAGEITLVELVRAEAAA